MLRRNLSAIAVPRAGRIRPLLIAAATVTTFAARPAVSSTLPRKPLSYVYSLLRCYPPLAPNNLIRRCSQRFDQFQHPFRKFLPGKYLENERLCLFPRMSIHTNLQWIVKIPNLENIIMNACNAIDQPMPIEHSTFT